MKKILPLSILVVALFLLRETGVVKVSLASTTSELSTQIHSAGVPNLNVTTVEYQSDTGEIFSPEIKHADDTYRCTIRYRIATSLSPWRWLPLVKFGSNQAQLTYVVWTGQDPIGCGAITRSGSVSMFGVASARDYRNAVTNSLVAEMKKSVDKKVHRTTRTLSFNERSSTPSP